MTLFSFDFAQAASWRTRIVELAPASSGGRINGVVQWLRVQLDAEASYENAPGPQFRSHWVPRFHPFDTPVEPPAGSTVPIMASHDGTVLTIWMTVS